MTQLEQLKDLATKDVPFWFISETQVGTRVPGSELVAGVADLLTDEEKNHLKQQVVTFKAAEFTTFDPILALAVLHAKDRLGAVPAKWELPAKPAPPPPEPEEVSVPKSDAEVAAAEKAEAKAKALADAKAEAEAAVSDEGHGPFDEPEPDPVVEAAVVEPEPKPGPQFPNSSPKRRARR